MYRCLAIISSSEIRKDWIDCCQTVRGNSKSWSLSQICRHLSHCNHSSDTVDIRSCLACFRSYLLLHDTSPALFCVELSTSLSSPHTQSKRCLGDEHDECTFVQPWSANLAPSTCSLVLKRVVGNSSLVRAVVTSWGAIRSNLYGVLTSLDAS